MIVVADRMKATDARVGASLVSIDVLRSLVMAVMVNDYARAFIAGFCGAVRPKSMMPSTLTS
jgi:hypothetical protein